MNDELFNGEWGFSGKSNEWITTTFAWYIMPVKNIKEPPNDTIIIRFNFISDSIQNNKEGWMIDNIRLYSVDFGSGIENSKNTNTISKIIPNPFKTMAKVKFDKFYKKIDIHFYNIQGKLEKKMIFLNKKEVELNRKNLKNGLYFLKIDYDNNITETKKILIE